jgi:hypothetical protein
MYELIQENLKILVPVVILNAAMLVFGYLGEMKKMSKYLAAFLGFIPFILMFYIIYNNYAVFSQDGIKTFWYFCGIWSLYGVVFMFPEETKNTVTNFLDLTAKCLVGLGLWAYYTGVLTI